MAFETWLTFVFTASIILVIPGPTIIYIVGQALIHGKRAVLPLSIGVISGDAICMIFSIGGLSAFLSLFSTAFLLVKYLGAAYLIFLGVKMIRMNIKQNSEQIKVTPYAAKGIFHDVFFVNALNPKGIIFYSAFMPQFVSPQENILFQFGLLAITFLSLALINVIGYSLLAARTNELFKSPKFVRSFNLTGGLGLICAGLYSAAIKEK